MSYEKPKVGGDVDAFCSRCGMDLAHTVVAMVADKVVQARCNTCGAFHKYRKPKTTKGGRAAASSTTKRSSSSRASGGSRKANARRPSSWEASWNAQVDQAGDRPIQNYRMSETFEKGDLVQHKSFGLGVVQQTAGNKVEILFREGMRTLAMGR